MTAIKGQKWAKEKKGKRTDNVQIYPLISRDIHKKVLEMSRNTGKKPNLIYREIIEKGVK